MPVRYVDLPENLTAALTFPVMGDIMRLLEPQFLIVAATLAFVASAETLLSATAVDRMHDGPKTKYNRELFSQGAGNILAGFAGGLPMTGVIVRSATNVNAGGKTRLSTMLHGGWLLLLVAAVPFILRLVPTASLAAVLVYTGYKLVNPQSVRRLLQYGGLPVLIYVATVIMIVTMDLLTGILTGVVLSVLKVLYGMSHLGMDVRHNAPERRIDVHMSGVATFIRLPKLVDTLAALPEDSTVHVHLADLQYIDHAGMDAIST
jgi:MFS superfamily sulfate permease-like transporter